jgi:hypothetical protein
LNLSSSCVKDRNEGVGEGEKGGVGITHLRVREQGFYLFLFLVVLLVDVLLEPAKAGEIAAGPSVRKCDKRKRKKQEVGGFLETGRKARGG